MTSTRLTSHHVNYLIWRYLQESGHGEAALMLQHTWNRDPQTLSFAPYIKPHALVTLVQKGLQYHELEQSLDQNGDPLALVPSTSFFGPNVVESHSPRQDGDRVETKDGPVATDQRPSSPKAQARRTFLDSAINGHSADPVTQPPSRKTRKAGGAENGEMAVNADDTPMEIDHSRFIQERAAAIATSPSPGEPVVDADGDVGMEGPHDLEPPTPIFTLTNGQSVGVQMVPAKEADLSPDTTILELAGDDHVARAAWRPNDPTVVAAAGKMFCGLWKLSGQRSSVTPSHEPLVENKGDRTWVTAMAWDSAGVMLAVATYNDLMGSITMYSVQGTAIDLLPDIPRMVSGLHWVRRGMQMVVVVSDGKNSELALWDQAVRPDEFPPPQVIDGQIYDVAWSGDNEIYACGDGSVYKCGVHASIHILKGFNSDDRHEPWTFVRASPMCDSSVAVVASPSTANIWIPTHDITIESAHHGDITAIELRPQPQGVELEKNTRLVLATSSVDDTVKIWHIDLETEQFHCVHRLFLGSGFPALVSAFSPDGYAIAAVSHDKLFIWNAERGGSPMSTWTVPNVNLKDETSQDGTGRSEDSEDSKFYRSLSWDSDGKKLALGFGKQLAIVNLQR